MSETTGDHNLFPKSPEEETGDQGMEEEIREEFRRYEGRRVEEGHLSSEDRHVAEMHILDGAPQSEAITEHLAKCELCKKEVHTVTKWIRRVRDLDKKRWHKY